MLQRWLLNHPPNTTLCHVIGTSVELLNYMMETIRCQELQFHCRIKDGLNSGSCIILQISLSSVSLHIISIGSKLLPHTLHLLHNSACVFLHHSPLTLICLILRNERESWCETDTERKKATAQRQAHIDFYYLCISGHKQQRSGACPNL